MGNCKYTKEERDKADAVSEDDFAATHPARLKLDKPCRGCGRASPVGYYSSSINRSDWRCPRMINQSLNKRRRKRNT